ncbi:MAG: hypothetical protein ACR2OZ_00870 [Verrucomicrobiales bacterium]
MSQPAADENPASPSDGARAFSRLSVYGDLWSRFMDWGVCRCPYFLEPPLAFGYTLVFFLLAGRQRRAVQRNLAVLLEASSRTVNFLRSFRVFWEFAWMLADAARSRHGERALSWELEGAEHFHTLAASKEGVIVLTAHMGSYDVAAPFFASKLGRRLTTVRVPDRQTDLQAYRNKERVAQQSETFRIRYNEPGAFLGVELAQALAAGEVIALQGDRVPDDVSPLLALRHGHAWLLPRGPFVLAQATGAAIYPIFILRMGWRRYRIVVWPPRQPSVADSREGRERELRALGEWWSGVLERMLRKNWWRWHAFEDFFQKPETAPPEGP